MVEAREEEIRKDIIRYRKIAEDRSLLNDIPRWNTVQKRPSQNKPSKRGRKKAFKLEKPTYTKSETRPKSWLPKLQSKPLRDGVGDIHGKATSFHDKLSLQLSYSLMIEQIRGHAESIDFGLAQRLLPKNIAHESAKFDISLLAPPLRQGPSLYSDDIDLFLRLLNHTAADAPQSQLI